MRIINCRGDLSEKFLLFKIHTRHCSQFSRIVVFVPFIPLENDDLNSEYNAQSMAETIHHIAYL